jgi:hypothetical protein
VVDQIRRMMQRIQTLTAKGSDGRNYLIDMYASAKTPHGPVAYKLLLRDGRNVQRIGKGHYVVGDVLIRSDDRGAP